MNQQLPVRLSTKEINDIKAAFSKVFSNKDQLWLFGSRACLNKKGGDIDLYIETNLTIDQVTQAKLDFARELFLRLDDRKIDIVINYKNSKHLPIYEDAKTSGVKIV